MWSSAHEAIALHSAEAAGEQLATIRDQPSTAFGNIDSLADAAGSPGERSITQRLDTIERVLFAVARAQGIDPDAVS